MAKKSQYEAREVVRIAYSLYSLNYSTIQRLDNTALRVYSALNGDDIRTLRTKVINSHIPEHYTFQIKTRDSVLDKIEKFLKKS